MLKKAKVVMLPTEKSNLLLSNQTNKLRLFSNAPNSTFNVVTCQHLYILSDDKIPYNPNGGTNGIFLCLDELNHPEDAIVKNVGNCGGCRAIIASTDESLGLPKVSEGFIKKFIEKYNAGIPITHVMVEYVEKAIYDETWKEENWEQDYIKYGHEAPKILVPKVDSHNTITIKAVKDSFTLEELESISTKFAQAVLDDTIGTLTFNKWFEKQNF